MNIREAAEQLERTIRAYGLRTQSGSFAVPKAAQRPVYLVGPPGVGKTAVVEQVARRLDIGFAAYTMTHHTRQSAIGLPVIERRSFGGEEFAVTEYTMSEIVASVWDQAEKRAALDGDAARGILFLDEINCVSEALMPAMLQLLQYKTFGQHSLPEGWIIVCAGNPVKYNRFAREFDPVVQDRIRTIEVEPDLDAWQQFAAEHGVHPSIRSYLHMRPEDFYAADGENIVTARSWTDLSDMMLALESMGETADGALFSQYLRCGSVSERFTMYHSMCNGAAARGMLDEILRGASGVGWKQMAFDEAVFVVLLLAGKLESLADECAAMRRSAEQLGYFADGVAREEGANAAKVCEKHIARLEHAMNVRRNVGALSDVEEAEEQHRLKLLRAATARAAGSNEEMLMALRTAADSAMKPVLESENALKAAIGNVLDFVENSIQDANVRLIFVKDLQNHAGARAFLSKHFPQRFSKQLKQDDPDARAERLRRELLKDDSL